MLGALKKQEPVKFIPPHRQLPECYRKDPFMLAFCNAVTDLYLKPYFDDVVVHHAIYAQYRYDLATKDTFDDIYERVFSDVYGLPYPWPEKEGSLAAHFDQDDWAKRRIYLQFLVRQLMFRPYTMKNITEFVTAVERELHYYSDEEEWVELRFGETSKNVLYIVGAENRRTVYGAMWDVLRTLFRRVCPCNIYVECIEE